MAQMQAIVAQVPGMLRDFRVSSRDGMKMRGGTAAGTDTEQGQQRGADYGEFSVPSSTTNCFPPSLALAKNFQQTRLSAIRPVQEFFDVQKVSRPQDLNDATRRISHNTRHFGGNYSLVGAWLSSLQSQRERD